MQGWPRTRSCELQHPWGRPNALRTRRFVRRTAGAGEVRCSWLPQDHRLALSNITWTRSTLHEGCVGGGCERLRNLSARLDVEVVCASINLYKAFVW